MKRTNTKGQIVLKCLLFGLIFLLIFLPVNQILRRKSLIPPWNMTTKVHGFYNEPVDTFDVMFFGSSHAYCSVNPLLLFEQTGAASYLFCSQQQPLWATYHFMEEAFKTQRPELAVVEVYMADEDRSYMDEGTNFSAEDDLEFSWNKLELIRALAPSGERLPYLLGFLKYHGRWDQLNSSDFSLDYLEERDLLRGYVLLDKCNPGEAIPTDVSAVTEQKPLTAKNADYLRRIVELCAREDVQLLLMKSPSNETVELKKRMNAVEAFAAESKTAFVDFNLSYDELGLTPEDFYDYGHLNYRGTEKFTSYFGAYLTRSYDLPDHRGESAYAGWSEDVEQYRRMVADLS